MSAVLFWASVLMTGGAGDLADNDFDVRQAASARLERWGALALPCVLAGEGSADAEVRVRCQVLHARIAPRFRPARLLMLGRAYRVVYDRDDPDLDMIDGVMVMAGGQELWDAINDLAAAEGLVPADSPPPEDELSAFNFTMQVRYFARGRVFGQSCPAAPARKLPAGPPSSRPHLR